MRHRVSGRKLNRTSSHRRAMFRNMATALFEHERIVTTLPKAKELRPVVEKLITQGRKGTLHARRHILSYVRSKDVAHKVMDEIAPRYADRPGGYIRILKLGYRDGDKTEMALVELIGSEPVKETPKKESKEKEKAGETPKTKTSRKKAAKKEADVPVESEPTEAEAEVDEEEETKAEAAADGEKLAETEAETAPEEEAEDEKK
ncbi:MAG: 50S ribosomal protein L17 [Acidobacteria bacterium]|nr:50S ribosomal protein L17 [Acidobacteriota bacterium]